MRKRVRGLDEKSDPYALNVTYGELKAYCESIVDSFRRETGISVQYDLNPGLPITVGTTEADGSGGSVVKLGFNGIAVNDPDDRRHYDEGVSNDAKIPDANVVCCFVTLEHELQHVRQNYAEWTHDVDKRAPSCLVVSHMAFQHNFELYLQSHLGNIRETDADEAAIPNARNELRLFRPDCDTDALVMEYVNSKWDDGGLYRIGKKGMEFESWEEIEAAFNEAQQSFFETKCENPYGFHDTEALWTDVNGELAMTVRSGTDLKSRKRWHDVFDSIQNSKTRAEFDRKAASVMLYIHPEYKDEFNLDGIDLSPKSVFGIDKFPESSKFVRDRLGLEKKPFWVVRTQAFRDNVTEPEDGLIPVDPLGGGTSAGDALRAKAERDRREKHEAVKPVRKDPAKAELERVLAGRAASAGIYGKGGHGGREGPG